MTHTHTHLPAKWECVVDIGSGMQGPFIIFIMSYIEVGKAEVDESFQRLILTHLISIYKMRNEI